MITIAHRLNTIQDYDVIVVMGDGNILEMGSYAELMENPDSHFYAMNS